MRYDFDSIVDRRAADAVKWHVADGELPMWVADMDFRVAPEIEAALRARLDHGVFGYGSVPDEWYDAYRGWWSCRHGLDIPREALAFCTGVIPAISSAVRRLTVPNENVVIQTPVYNIFFNCIKNNGARVLESPLAYEGGAYSIDFCDLERKFAEPQTTLMLLCNPHNPVGRIWTRDELAGIGRLAKKHGVTVISDEIHCDVTAPGTKYVPFASVSDECREVSVTCIAPTKAFNIAGLGTAAVAVFDPRLRARIVRAINTDEVAEPSSFAVCAAVAAFREGGAWLDEMREYVFENRRIAEEYIAANAPALFAIRGEATYLLWIDGTRAARSDGESLAKYIRRKSGLFLSDGAVYGECGRNFLRMNLACPRPMLIDGLGRLAAAVGKGETV